MAGPSTPTAAAKAARRLVVASLKEDHKDVKRALREFEKLDAKADAPRMQAVVARTLALLEMHATLELELFYPALRAAAVEVDLVDEAEIEHASMTALIEQSRRAGPSDAKYVARIKVLGEYVRHHVKEEEGELFPACRKAGKPACRIRRNGRAPLPSSAESPAISITVRALRRLRFAPIANLSGSGTRANSARAPWGNSASPYSSISLIISCPTGAEDRRRSHSLKAQAALPALGAATSAPLQS